MPPKNLLFWVPPQIKSQPALTAIWMWGPAIVMMASIFILSAQSQLPGPDTPLLDVILKKTGHMIGYALLYLCLFRALAHTWPDRPSTSWLTLGLCILYAMSDEWHQSFVPGRQATIMDVAIDTLGAGLMMFKLRGMRPKTTF